MSSRCIALALVAVTVGCRRAPPENQAAAATPPPSKTAFYAPTFSKNPKPAALMAIGRALFVAPELSRSGTLACASCHDPAHAYGPPNSVAVQRGGSDGHALGTRAAPSLRYQQQVPTFTLHYEEPDGDGNDQGPAGGYTWDGHAGSRHDQAMLPLFSPLEMANGSRDEFVLRLRDSRIAPLLRENFGDDVFASTDSALKAILRSLEAFEDVPAEFYPYDSKYDAFLRRKVALSPRETRGLDLFVRPDKGNCASCHSHRIHEGNFPAFTDFGFNAIGVPRNPEIPANADPAYFDMGLCGPYRTDLKEHHEYCGLFRVPSLRNVTRKKRFFHNGWATSLKQVLRFYALRDVRPAQFYPGGQPYDDLPAQYRANVNLDPPFGKRSQPALSEAEMDDIIVFLGTLEDGYGYDPPKPKP
jgi:cytochrome c peroxidase